MRAFRPLWKVLAKDKSITREDVLQYGILRAMAAKNPDKHSVARGILQTSFTPVTNKVKLENGQKPYQSLMLARYDSFIRANADRPGILLSALETDEEVSKYNELLSTIGHSLYDDLNEYYSYVLVRTDVLSPEQVAVQVGHACVILGAQLMDVKMADYKMAMERLNHLNLVVCGVKNEAELKGGGEYLNSVGYKSVHFIEPDIGNQMTAVASEPIKSTKKRVMKRYRLLKYY